MIPANGNSKSRLVRTRFSQSRSKSLDLPFRARSPSDEKRSKKSIESSMESSRCVGLMVVVAVSAAAAVFALEVHKRLASYFIRKLESEIGRQASNGGKKKVTFAPDVVEPSSDSKEYRRRWRSRRRPDSG